MSTLTKVLIVLLTVFSIFLCGIVVTYVANSENQRKRADGLQTQFQAARQRQQGAEANLDQAKKDMEIEKGRLNGQLTEFGTQIKNLLAELDLAKRENAQLVQKVASMAATVETANATAKQQTTLFETAQQEVRGLLADQSDRKKEIDETNQMLVERLAIIAQLEEKNRRLVEENQDLQTQLNKYLQQTGRMATRPPTTVPARTGTVGPAAPQPPQTRAIALSGRITAVDMKNRLAEISIGSAAGVKQDMTFHIVRGDRWAAKMLILDVSPDKAVGILDLVQLEPQVGDTVTTNL